MIRICTSLANNGYKVTLVGRKMKHSVQLTVKPFVQKRLTCFFHKGAAFYAEYNIRLLFWLMFQKADCICAIDLDTILPCLFVSKLKGTKRVYDAHELFCEMKEIVSRPSRYKLWKWIERFAVPRFANGYTVCQPIAREFKKMYGVNYGVVKNVPVEEQGERYKEQEPGNKEQENRNLKSETFFIYQGAVNEGRSFETLVPAMKDTNAPLHIYGDGNFFNQTKELISKHQLEQKILLKGKLEPHQLKKITPLAFAGITIFENNGLSNYLSLGNRFFDYIQAGIPQVCVDYPAYREINESFEVALLIPDIKPETISNALNLLLTNSVLYNRLKENCLEARLKLNWKEEEKIIIQLYQSILG
jgi:glycosyltransferase involved in cell wall biosynthesis